VLLWRRPARGERSVCHLAAWFEVRRWGLEGEQAVSREREANEAGTKRWTVKRVEETRQACRRGRHVVEYTTQRILPPAAFKMTVIVPIDHASTRGHKLGLSAVL